MYKICVQKVNKLCGNPGKDCVMFSIGLSIIDFLLSKLWTRLAKAHRLCTFKSPAYQQYIYRQPNRSSKFFAQFPHSQLLSPSI